MRKWRRTIDRYWRYCGGLSSRVATHGNLVVKKTGQSPDLVPIVIYGLALLFMVVYVWLWTSDETWGPGGNISYEFSPSLRMTAGVVALAFVTSRFAVHLWRYWRSLGPPSANGSSHPTDS